MRKPLLLAFALVLTPSALAGAKQRVRVIDGKAVVGGEQLALKQFLTVRRLVVYECIYEDTGKPCTVVTGELLSLLPGHKIDVVVRVDFYRAAEGERSAIRPAGSATAIVTQPPRGKVVPFYALGPDIFDERKAQVQAAGEALGYNISLTIQKHREQ